MNHPIVIMKDFNYPGINWSTFKTDDTGYKFIKLILDCYLEQHVNMPTRNNNILDLIFTNELEVQNDAEILAPIDNSDHNVVLLTINCNINRENSNKTKLCFNRADFNGMRKFVRDSLFNVDSKTMSASFMWDKFNDVMQDAIKLFVPVCTVGKGKKKPM